MKTAAPTVSLLGLMLFSALNSPAGGAGPDARLAALEQEWLLEARFHSETRLPTRITPEDDARGGCDGVINGRWGFHTAIEDAPWWQVDLGRIHTVGQVRIWNRSDSVEAARRAAHLRVLCSTDGSDWHPVYEHDGTTFFGYRMPDRHPFTIRLAGVEARFVRIQLPGTTCLHLDEVEIIGEGKDGRNLALNRPASQSSLSPWSVAKWNRTVEPEPDNLPFGWVIERGLKLAARFRAAGVDTAAYETAFRNGASQADAMQGNESADARQKLYLQLRANLRELALRNPLIDFDSILFTKRVPGSFNHMSDQNYGWWSRPGGGIHILRGFKDGEPSLHSLTDAHFPEPGSFHRSDLSPDGQSILFAWCKHYPWLAGIKNKLDKANVPEDAFYHIFELRLDGTGLRRLTGGKYDDFDPRYLPDGRIVFLSTRRGQSIQAGRQSAAQTAVRPDLPDCYVRCGGDASRPVAVYTLHTMNADGGDLTAISPFEMFEWDPSVAHDGTILYSRWDYVDRDNMPYMSLWAINPDGSNARLVYGNHTQAPHCTFEPRNVPGSRKILFTAAAHHAQTMGSLVLLDPDVGTEGEAPLTRLTPETPFPEIEGWPRGFHANPWPLSEETHLVSWGVEEEVKEGRQRPANGMGLYLFDVDGGLELLYRDPEISSMHPIPLRSRTPAPRLASHVDWDGPQEGHFLVADVYQGLTSARRGDITRLRVIGIPAKTQPEMNRPVLGLTRDDPGKTVLGTVPVERDGSAYFRVPSGVALFLQALNRRGMAVQTMRSATHVQPGQTLGCVGCHESRTHSPPAPTPLLALRREPSRITPGPDGSWPLRFDRLVQPVLDRQCVRCHRPDGEDAEAAKFDLTPAKAYESLADHGRPSLRDLVLDAYREGVSIEGRNPAQRSALLFKLSDPAGHHGIRLSDDDFDRLITWLDSYGQRQGHFSTEQEEELKMLRVSAAALLEPIPPVNDEQQP